MNFIESLKKWSSQNRTNRTSSYAYAMCWDKSPHDVVGSSFYHSIPYFIPVIRGTIFSVDY